MSNFMQMFFRCAIGFLVGYIAVGILSKVAFGATPEPVINKDRVVVINDIISKGNIMALVPKMEAMAKKSKAPIDLIINSPGGEVITGFAFINAMEALKGRGIQFNCYVPNIAASMAFQILVHCNRRVVLDKAFLLWHGVRVQLGGGLFSGGQVMTHKSSAALAEDLRAIDAVIIKELKALQLPTSVVMYHFDQETLHVGENLADLAPRFVKSYSWVPGLLEALNDKNVPGANPEGPAMLEPGQIVYIREDMIP